MVPVPFLISYGSGSASQKVTVPTVAGSGSTTLKNIGYKPKIVTHTHLYSLVLGSAEEQILRGEDGQHRPIVSLRHIAAYQRTLAANPPLVRINNALVRALPLPDVCAGDKAGEDVLSRRRGFFA
jgi:hypothetical protein